MWTRESILESIQSIVIGILSNYDFIVKDNKQKGFSYLIGNMKVTISCGIRSCKTALKRVLFNYPIVFDTVIERVKDIKPLNNAILC